MWKSHWGTDKSRHFPLVSGETDWLKFTSGKSLRKSYLCFSRYWKSQNLQWQLRSPSGFCLSDLFIIHYKSTKTICRFKNYIQITRKTNPGDSNLGTLARLQIVGKELVLFGGDEGRVSVNSKWPKKLVFVKGQKRTKSLVPMTNFCHRQLNIQSGGKREENSMEFDTLSIINRTNLPGKWL